MKLYQKIAGLIQARKSCQDNNNSVWFENHTDKIIDITNDHFPHGSGFDSRVFFDLELSTPEKLVIIIDYHHMDEYGDYDGWSTLKVIVKPSLTFGFNLKLTGVQRKYRHDKEYFMDVVGDFLDMEC